EVAAFFGDVIDSGTPFNLGDVSTISTVASLNPNVVQQTIPGFTAFPCLDPVIIGDVALVDLGGIVTTDTSAMNQELTSPRTTIPWLPVGLTVTIVGPDPTLSVDGGQWTVDGEALLVPVNIDTARPEGSTGMTDAILALSYDPKVFDISAADVKLGT